MKNIQDEILEQLRLIRNYNYVKLKSLEKTLRMLMEFSRQDLKRIDEIEKKLKGEVEDEN